MKIKYSLIIIAYSLMPINAMSQKLQLIGKVADSLTNEGLAYANIYNVTLKKGIQTDALGNFKLDIMKGENHLRITHIGCSNKNLIKIFSHSLDTIIYLAHHQHDLDDINITAEKTKLILLEKDRINHQDLIISGSKPIASILDKMPGVGSLKTGTTIAKPMIQGMIGSRVVIINNGLKQEGQQWGQEHGLEIDPYNTGQISLIKGAEALRYSSDAIGGILLIDPAYNPTDSLKWNLTSAYTDNGKQINLSSSVEKMLTKKMGIRTQLSYKKAGNLKTPHYFLPNTGFEELDGSFCVKWQISKKHLFEIFSSNYNTKLGILSISHIGNLTDLQKIINSDSIPSKGSFTYKIDRPFQQINHWLNKVKWKYEASPSLSMEAVYGLQLNNRKEFDSHNYFNKTGPSLNFSLYTHQLDFIIQKKIRQNWLIKGGVNGYFQTNFYQGRYFIPNYKKIELYQFALARYKKHKHELEFGYRAGTINLQGYKWVGDQIVNYPFKYKGISWQLGWLYKINHDWQTALQAGSAWRNPNISELFSEGLHHGAAAIEYGNKNLKSENAVTLNGTIKYRHNKTLFETEFYYKQVNNYIYLQPKFPAELTIRGAFPAFEYLQTTAVFTGMDLLLEQRISKHFYFTEKATLLMVIDKNHSTYLNNIPPFQFNHSINYKINHLKKVNNLLIKISFQQVLSQKRYTEGSDYLAPPKGYNLINVMLSSNFSRYKNLLVFLTADNIMNLKYRNYLNRFRYYADETGRMITAGISLNII